MIVSLPDSTGMSLCELDKSKPNLVSGHPQGLQLLSGGLVVWLQPQRLPQVSGGLVAAAKLGKHCPQMAVRLRMGRNPPQHLPILCRRPLELAL